MDIKEIYNLLNFLSPTILSIGIAIGIYYRKSLDNITKSIAVYLSAMLLVDIVVRIVGAYYENNFLILLIYCILELIMFSYFYYKFLFKSKHRLIFLLAFLAFGYIISEIYVFKTKDFEGFQSYAKVADNFIIILLAFTFFYEKFNSFKELNWDNFRLNTVVLVFFSINLLFFLPINFLINETSGLKHYFWLGNLTITVLFYAYLTYCIWKNGRTRKLLPSGSR